VYSKWTPSPDTTIHQFVVRADGEGGFAVTESDDLVGGTLGIFKLSPFFEYAIYPVLDIEEAVGLFAEAVEWGKSALRKTSSRSTSASSTSRKAERGHACIRLGAFPKQAAEWFGSLGSDKVAVEFDDLQTVTGDEVAAGRACPRQDRRLGRWWSGSELASGEE
jgi:Domain of unknown function (DUF3303)